MSPLAPLVYFALVVLFEFVLAVPSTGDGALSRSHNRGA